MRCTIVIPEHLESVLRAHLFQNELEQGAFLFSKVSETSEELLLEAEHCDLVPPSAWEVQFEDYLEMKDGERAKIMKRARDSGLAAIECHSHPDSRNYVWFSPSDQLGIREFAPYVKWKLEGRPYGATVWGESSVDAVIWHGDFAEAHPVQEIRVVGSSVRVLIPRNTWFERPASHWLRKINGN